MQTSTMAGRIASLAATKDLAEAKRICDELCSNHANAGDKHELAIAFCNTLSSRDLGDHRAQDALVSKMAWNALGEGANMSLDKTVMLVAHLQSHINAAVSEVDDTTVLSAFLQAWQQLEKQKDSNFDAAVLPSLYPEIPDGLDIIPGGDPTSVADPAKRGAYDAAIAAHAATVTAYNSQFQLRRLSRFFVPIAENFVVELARKNPSIKGSLESLFDAHNIPKAVLSKIV